MRGARRRLTGAGAVVAACALACGAAVPAVADTAPLGGREWWFNSWRVQTDIWPNTKGAGVIVAVLDSGVASVPDLSGVVLPGYDVSDHHGDDRHDIDAHSHGTRMASLIAAQGNATGMLGLAPKAKILPVITGEGVDSITDQEMADAIRWAADHGANVVNMSFGADGSIGGCPQPVQDAVRHAVVDKDAVLIAAAGNSGDTDNPVSFPADCVGVVAVGAVDRMARPWPKSQRQPYVDVAAPGVDMAGVDRTGRLSLGADGTSDAAALTSAGIALIRSAHPELTGRQVVARLLATLRDRPPAGQKDPQRGYGTILLDKAVNDSIPLDAPNPIYDELQAGTPSAVPASASPPIHSGASVGMSPVRSSGSSAAVILVTVLAGTGGLTLVGLVLLAVRRRRPPVTTPYRSGPAYQPTADGTPYQASHQPPWQSGPGSPPPPMPPGRPKG